MANVWEHFVLHGQECTTRVNEVDTRKMILMSNRLRTDVLLDRHWVIGTALDGCIVGYEENFPAVNTADTGDNACGVSTAIVQIVCSEWREFEERRPRIDDALNTFTCKHFVTTSMTFNVLLATTLVNEIETFTQRFNESKIVLSASRIIRIGFVHSCR